MIGLFEVEDVFIYYLVVKEVVVVVSFDEICGMVVKVFIVLKDGYEGMEDFVYEL